MHVNTFMQHNAPVFDETINIITTTNTAPILSTCHIRNSDWKEKKKKLSYPGISKKKFDVSTDVEGILKSASMSRTLPSLQKLCKLLSLFQFWSRSRVFLNLLHTGHSLSLSLISQITDNASLNPKSYPNLFILGRSSWLFYLWYYVFKSLHQPFRRLPTF